MVNQCNVLLLPKCFTTITPWPAVLSTKEWPYYTTKVSAVHAEGVTMTDGQARLNTFWFQLCLSSLMELFLNLHMLIWHLKLWAGQPGRQYPQPDPVKTHGIPLFFHILSPGSQISNTHSLAPCMPFYTPGSCLWTSYFCSSHGLPISSIRLPPSHSLLRHGPHFSGQYSEFVTLTRSVLFILPTEQ